MQGDFENCCSISLGVTPKKCRSKAYCSALNCGNAKFRKPEISYFRFPRDPKRSHLWVNNCGLKSILDDVPVQTLYRTRLLCSEHFAPSQFMNPEMRNKLIWNAIPTIFNHHMPVKQELDQTTRKMAVIFPKTLCLPRIWTSAAFGLNHYVNGHTNLNQMQVVNNGMDPVQIVNTVKPVHAVNSNMNPFQVVRTIESPLQIVDSVPDRTQPISDPVQSLEKRSARVQTVSSPSFTLHLTCDDVSDNHSEDSLLEANGTGQSMYVCCEKCKGLWRKESFPTDHLLRCCGTVDASSADLFAIERDLLLVLHTHIGCLRNKTGLLDSGDDVEALCKENSNCCSDYCNASKVSFLASTDISSREVRVPSAEDISGKEGLASIEIPHLSSASPLTRGVNMEKIVSMSSPRLSESSLEDDSGKDAVSVDTINADKMAASVHVGNKFLPVSNAEKSPVSVHMLDIAAPRILDTALERTDSVEGICTVLDVREEHQMKYSAFLVDMCHRERREMRYQCSSCPFSTRMVEFFDRHVRSCHNDPVTCDVCSLSFENRSRFRKHMNMHVHPFMCEFCSRCFAEKRELEKHSWIHKGDVLKCQKPTCDFTTCYRRALENHRTMKHSSCKSFTRDSCKYRTNCRSSLRKHQRLHQGRGDYVCCLCPFQAVVRHDLMRHLRKHTSEKTCYSLY